MGIFGGVGLRALATAAPLLAILGCSGGGSQPPDDGDPTTPPAAATWSKSLGGPGDDWANTVIATRDGGYLFAGVYDHQQTGNSGNPPIEGDFWVAKLDALGDTQWQQSLGEHRSGAAGAASIFHRARAGADGYWMVGTRVTPGPSGVATNRDTVVDLLVARLNDDGSVRWTQVYDSGGFDSREFFYANETARERGWDIVPTRDGGALVAAWSSGTVRVDASNGVPVAAPWIVKINATGQVLWNRRISETQYDYLAEEPAELLVRETAQNGAIVAATARVRGDSPVQSPEPAMQLTRIDSGGAVHWTQRYSRLIARDLIQVEEDLDGLADDGFVIVGDDIAVLYVLDGDRDTIMMKFDRDDGTEDWRAVIEEGVTLESVVQVCMEIRLDVRGCHYAAAGSGKIDDEGAVFAMAASITADGDIDELRAYEGLERATGMRTGVARETEGSLQLVGYRPFGGSFSLLLRPNLLEVERNETDLVAGAHWLYGPPLQLESNGRVVALSAGETARLQVFAPDLAAVFDRSFGVDSEFRGERAFGAIEVSDGYVVVGQSDSSGTTRNPATLVTKLQPDGSVRWQNFLENLQLFTPAHAPYAAIASASDGGFVIAGVSYDSATTLTSLAYTRAVKLDATGAVQWTSAQLDAAGFSGPSVTGIYRAADGSFYVIGESALVHPSTDGPWVTRIDAQGAVVWRRQLRPVGLLTGGTIDGDGLVIAGVTLGAEAHVPWAARVSSAGDLQWMHTYEAGIADHEPLARIVSATSGGFFLAASHVVATGLSNDAARVAAGRRNIVLIRLAADGTARWHRTYGALYDETLYGLDATSDGGAVLAGRSDSLGEGAEAWILRLGPDGRVSEGCNALRTAEPGTNYSRVTTTWEDDFDAPAPRTFALGVGSRAASVPLQAIRNSVLARQCSGVARPDGGGTPPTGFRLSVVQGSPGSPGVVTSSPAGITCGTSSNTCEANYVANTSVILRIDPGARNRFQGWAGCDSSTADQCIVTMDRDRSVTASFLAIDAPRLALSVSGNGTVTGGGLDCANGSAGTCSSSYQPGQIVTLAATPGATETFTGWGSDCVDFGRASPIDIEMNRSRECSATFTGGPLGSPRVTITLQPAPQAPLIGYVRSVPEGLTCGSIGSDCTQTFAAGTTVRLDGVSTDGNYDFETFNCSGQLDTPGSRRVEFVISGDVTCTGTFSTGIERLGLRIATDVGAGTPGRVYSQPASGARGLDCQEDCDRPFTRNEVVTLRAEPLPDHFFNGWSGCDVVSGDPLGGPRPICTVTMNRTRNVAALFSIQHIGQDAVRTLAVSFPFDSGAGTVRDRVGRNQAPFYGINDCTPDSGRCEFGYDLATDVVLLIEPFGNNTLLQNEGCDTFVPASGGNLAECHLRMGEDRGVVFGFGTVNAVPVASITRTPSGNVAVNQSIQFSAAGSTDDGGTGQLTYQWDFDSDGVVDSTAMEASHVYTAVGTYRVQLVVTDRFGAIGLEATQVDVVAVNAPPVATFTYSPALPLVGESISFNARASSDDGRIDTYNWDFTNDGTFDVTGGVLSASLTQFAYNSAGTYLARLQVVDNDGQTSETTRSITVSSPANLAQLTLNIRGDGDGVVSYIPEVGACSKNGFANEPTCVRLFPLGTQVLLRATAYTSVGSVLGDWVGCTSINASGTECTVNLTTNRAVTLFINN